MFGFLKLENKPKAVAFVDYDYWFFSSVSRWGIRPNVSAWRKELEKRFRLTKVVFFADFSVERIRDEIDYLESLADEVIDIQNVKARKNKDITDFLMLDRLYQTAHTEKRILNYVLFTGDSLFRSAVSFLAKNLKKRVVCYGVNGSFSSALRDAASEVIELPTEEEVYLQYREYIIENLAYCVDHSWIVPTFSSTVDAVCKKRNLQIRPVKAVLARMLEEGYLYQRSHSFGVNRRTKVICADWDRLISEGLFTPYGDA